jgi:Fic family protein
MIKIEKKIIKNKPFFYLTEQVNLGGYFKKIQVYIGKNIPNNLDVFRKALREKESELIAGSIENIYSLDKTITVAEYKKIEAARLKFKYYLFGLSEFKEEIFWRDFAIRFIFESNAIEGSKLSQKEVEAIVKKKYFKKSADKSEIKEAENSIKAFNLVRSGKFVLNQRSIIGLHKILIAGLGVKEGYKKEEVVVNNKPTTAPGEVRKNMADLLKWWNKQKRDKTHPFIAASVFHQRFERIHPFSDGNGRTGRLLYNWMLLKSGYGVILFKNKNRQAYFSALDQADEGRPRKLYRHCIEVYRKTIDSL